MSADSAPSQRSVSLAEARFERLYHQHYQAVLAYCLRRTSYPDAYDTAAETFVVAWRRLEAVPQGDQTRPWLYGVAYRVISHRWRRLRRDRNLLDRIRSRSPEATDPGPEPQVVRSAEHELVHQAAKLLSAADQEILRLAMWEDLSTTQIAEALGTSVAAAKQRFHRAKTRLARHYTRLAGPDSPKAAPRGGAE